MINLNSKFKANIENLQEYIDYANEHELAIICCDMEDGVEVLTFQETISETDKRIANLKQNLAQTDYQALKYAEGELTEEEYAPMKEQRKRWREEINKLQKNS